ncbi:DUF2382 domain-containing protein [Kineococcus sp. SYSU DK005]|uniref:DUF2382 domain-containing protein n=1 Tax=Kineococcus sp. SYSU DK005 TaxID=3383126 RepID=UPI003D7DABD5
MAGTTFSADALYGTTVYDNDGDKIGKVDEVYLDNATNQPEWVSVKTGLFGSNVSLIPLSQASVSGEKITVPFEKAKVKDAPHHDPGHELSERDEDDLYAYYGIASSGGSVTGTSTTGTTGTAGTGTADLGGTDRSEYQSTTTGRGREETTGTAVTGGTAGADVRGAGHDTSGPNTDDAMTRSKEELHVGTETREAGRARLRKYITSETVTRTVPVSHEEVVVEREPITEANRGAALSGGELTEEEHEVTLHEERAVAAKETVPVERVRLGTKTVTGEETVSAEVREEHIDLDADQATRAGTDRDRS